MARTTDDADLPVATLWGRWLLGTSIGLLVIGNIAMRTVFPERQGEGLTPGLLMILIPIWTVGLLGIGLCILGWLQAPKGIPVWDQDRACSVPLSRGTAVLITVVVCLLQLAAIGVLFDLDPDVPYWRLVLLSYCVTVYTLSTLFLLWWYRDGRHAGTATYFGTMTMFVGFLLLPLVWPLLVAVEVAIPEPSRSKKPRRRRGPTRQPRRRTAANDD